MSFRLPRDVRRGIPDEGGANDGQAWFRRLWSVEDIGAAFVVKDSTELKLAYVYYEKEPGRRSSAKLLTRDEARRIAANIAKLPGLLVRKRPGPPV